MITKPTVLILGAGASAEYGFPVGYGLCQMICRGECGTPPLPPQRECDQELADHQFNEFREELSQSGQLSVDAFLETRLDLLDIGRRAIACGLIPFENEDRLFAAAPESGSDPRWYQLLVAELGSGLDALAGNRLSVLTFNYDRSFEHFLVVSLSRKYSVSRSRAWEVVQTIPVHHLYGSLGAYTPGDGAGRPYEDRITFSSVQQCVESIRIVREGALQDDMFATAHQILRQAAVVVILGFRFDPTNLERLKVNLVPSNASIYASGFRMTKHERERAKDLIGRDVSFGEDHQGNTAFLRNHVTLE